MVIASLDTCPVDEKTDGDREEVSESTWRVASHVYIQPSPGPGKSDFSGDQILSSGLFVDDAKQFGFGDELIQMALYLVVSEYAGEMVRGGQRPPSLPIPPRR